MTAKREDVVMKLKLCELAGRHDDMVENIRELVTILPKNQSLTEEERQLLAVAFKNEVGVRRKSLKTLQKVGSSKRTMNPEKTKAFNEYRDMISRELEDLCNELMWMVDSKLLPAVTEPIEDIFYHKLKADYYRYLAEMEEDSSIAAEYITKAQENYEGATEYSVKNLAATHPLCIGLAMNYSVFIQEMLNDTTKAHDHAKHFYDDALDEMEEVREVDEGRYNECAYLLKLMHENIKVWAQEIGQTESNQSTV